MATSSSFKQQCPSCEAMVPIRDPGLVGKKIDCPKCKYRFLVEEPAPEEEPEDEDGGEEVKGKGKSTAITDKKGKRLRDESVTPEEDEEAKPKPPNSKVLYLSIGVGVFALVALIGGGILIFGGGSSKPAGGGSAGGSPGAPPKGGASAAPAVAIQPPPPKEAPPVEADAGPLDEMTNLLPNETVVLASVEPDKLRDSSAKHSLLEEPGSFTEATFKRTFDFPLENVKRFLTAVVPGEKPEEPGFFSIMRMEKPYSRDCLTKSLNLTPLPPVEGLASFVVNGDLDTLSAFFLRFSSPASAKINLHFADGQTLIFADAAPMKKFLEAKRHPPQMTLPPPAAPEPGAAPPPPAPPIGNNPAPAAPAGPKGKIPKGNSDNGTSGRRETLFRQPGGPPATDKDNAQDGAKPQPVEAEPAASELYLTIHPSMKVAMDRLEKEKLPCIFSLAVLVKRPRVLTEAVSSPDAVDKELISKVLPRLPMPQGTNVLALALRDFSEIKASGMIVLQSDSDENSRRTKVFCDMASEVASALFRSNWTMDVKVEAGTGPRPVQRQGAFLGGVPEMAPRAGPAATGKDGKIVTLIHDKTVAITLDLNLNHDLYEEIRDGLTAEMIQMKGLAELVANRPRIHELARALQAYVKAKGSFPRGAMQRPPSSERGIDWYPDQRLSWMVELLPFLGDGEFKDLGFDPERAWYDRSAKQNEGTSNLLTAQVLIPQFLSPGDPLHARVRYPGKMGLFGATRYVGIAGVGLDAAGYPAGNADFAKKVGVFGYDRVTKPDDIHDEPENTIAVLQIPSGQIAPWMAGGGSTVRGVLEGADPVKPFVCAEYKGKKGTFAIMADGKVRFIAADMKPDTFRALCTIAGGERIDDINEIAPLVAEEGFLESKTPAVIASAPAGKGGSEAATSAAPPPPAGAVPAAPGPATTSPPPATSPATAPPVAKAGLPAGWKELVDEQGGFAVAVPPGATSPQTLPPMPGVASSKSFTVAGKDDSKYGVTYLKWQLAVPPAAYPKIFEAIRSFALKGSKVAAEKPLQLEGNSGVEWLAESPATGKTAARCYIVKDQVYLLFAIGSKADAKEVEAFFNSFRLLKK